MRIFQSNSIARQENSRDREAPHRTPPDPILHAKDRESVNYGNAQRGYVWEGGGGLANRSRIDRESCSSFSVQAAQCAERVQY